MKMSEEEKVEEAEKLGLPKGNPSALGKITTSGYASLELIRYFTCESHGTRLVVMKNCVGVN